MRRLVVGAILAAAIIVTVRKMAPAMRSRCAEACEQMLSNMPESFPPNRMMADLETIKEQTARIIDLVGGPTKAESESSS